MPIYSQKNLIKFCPVWDSNPTRHFRFKMRRQSGWNQNAARAGRWFVIISLNLFIINLMQINTNTEMQKLLDNYICFKFYKLR